MIDFLKELNARQTHMGMSYGAVKKHVEYYSGREQRLYNHTEYLRQNKDATKNQR